MAVLLMAAPSLTAQHPQGMSFNGATGLYLIPSAYVGWGGTSPFGVDVGYHTGIQDRTTHIVAANFTVLRWAELSAAFDIRDNYQYGNFNDNNNDLILGAKVQLPVSPSFVLAAGGNFQLINLNNNRGPAPSWYGGNIDGSYYAGQAYLVVTYTAAILGLEADASVFLGKSFYKPLNSTIDFGIGIDCLLLPQCLKRVVHGIIEFSNFSYSVNLPNAFSPGRGIMNLGLRLDFSALPVLSKFKVILDAMLTDCFDVNRSFALGLALGLPF
jgi:hypothetical protein